MEIELLMTILNEVKVRVRNLEKLEEEELNDTSAPWKLKKLKHDAEHLESDKKCFDA